MRTFVILLATTLGLQGAAAFSDNSNQLTLVVGFAPGGTSSVAARFIADSIQKITGSDVIVENRPGAGGAIAAKSVRDQTGSRTLLFMSSTSSLKVPPDTGLVPVGILATYAYVAVARKDSPATLAEYMSAALRNDSLRNVATAGAGSIPHLIGAKLFNEHGVPMVHIPYQGSAPAIVNVVGGHVTLAIVPFPDFISFKETLRVVAETGNGIETEGWLGIFAPPGTSVQEVARLADIFRHASERSKEKLESVGFRQVWRPATELQRVHESENAQWQPMLERLGVKP